VKGENPQNHLLWRVKMEKDKEIKCKDMGMDCDFLACGRTEEEVLRKAGEHAQTVHGITGYSQELYDKARAAIKEGFCDYGGKEEEMVSDECSECYESCVDCEDECCC
jgi:predicted small metal-binding protein